MSGFTIAVAAAAACVNGEQQAALTVQVRLLKLMPLYMQWIATVTGLRDQTVEGEGGARRLSFYCYCLKPATDEHCHIVLLFPVKIQLCCKNVTSC